MLDLNPLNVSMIISAPAAAAVAAFSPASLSGLVTFVEVDRGVEESDGTVPEDGENIKYWRDEWSGNDNDFLQGTTANQPVYDTSLFGGYSAKFDGTNDFMAADIAAARIPTTGDLYVVLFLHTPSGWTGSGENFISCLDSANNRGWALYCTSSKLRVNMANNYLSSSLQVDGSTVYAADTNYIIEVIYNGEADPEPEDIEIYVNGSEDSYTTISDTLSTNTIQGTGDVDIATQQGGAGAFMDMDYAAIGIYTTIPIPDQRTELRTYLEDKYGV